MTWDPDTSAFELGNALTNLDDEVVQRLIDDLLRHLKARTETYPELEARRVLRLLRRKCQFERLRAVADAFQRAGTNGAFIQLDYAQALLDLGQLPAAEAFLERLCATTATQADNLTFDETQREAAKRASCEARGMLGRCLKQAYVTASPAHPERPTLVERAIASYSQVYEEQPSDPYRRWHGINSVALALRAEKDGFRPALGFEPSPRAEQMLRAIERSEGDPATVHIWDCAIAMEACIARGDTAGALRWLQRYVAGEVGVDAFEVSSTRRQLLEVWRLNYESEPGALLLPLLDARLLSLRGGSISFEGLPPDAEDISSLENTKQHGDSFIQVQSYVRGLRRAEAVARIEAEDGRGLGTGFLVRGGELWEPWANELFVVTNAHVVAQQESSGRPHRRPNQVRVAFRFSARRRTAPFLTEVVCSVWESPIDDLDVCILRLAEQPRQIAPIPIMREAPKQGSRLFIIGYPGGGELSFSLADNLLVELNDDYLHHRLATAKGSSGSPVLDDQWRVMGLHHAWRKHQLGLQSVRSYAAGEAARISAICAAIPQAQAY
jgi:V8-like Glu-specific endopeptidase